SAVVRPSSWCNVTPSSKGPYRTGPDTVPGRLPPRSAPGLLRPRSSRPGRNDLRPAALLASRVPLGGFGIDPHSLQRGAGDVNVARGDSRLVRQLGRGGCPALLPAAAC